MSILFTIIIFIFILGLLIFVHELGHFIMAKRSGMKVEEFGFGFPPRLFGIKKGETVYSLNWIPLGGFVKILGEESGSPEAQDPHSFASKGFGKRFSVLISGVAMNFLLAGVLFFIGFWLVGTPIEVSSDEELPAGVSLSERQLTIVAVQPETPAEAVGFKPGDAILSVDGQKFDEIQTLIAYNKDKAGQEVLYELKRGDSVFTAAVVPRAEYPEGSGPVGFAPAIVAIGKYPLLQSLSASVSALFSRTGAILSAFGLVFRQLFADGKLIEGLAGPVGIAVLTRDFVELGLPYLVQFTAVLSINLTIINGLPFPALDGGRVLFLLIEKIRGVKSLKWEQIANAIGFTLLILLLIIVTFRDVSRLF